MNFDARIRTALASKPWEQSPDCDRRIAVWDDLTPRPPLHNYGEGVQAAKPQRDLIYRADTNSQEKKDVTEG